MLTEANPTHPSLRAPYGLWMKGMHFWDPYRTRRNAVTIRMMGLPSYIYTIVHSLKLIPPRCNQSSLLLLGEERSEEFD